jgi:pyrimidine deaminase RibD-like protein
MYENPDYTLGDINDRLTALTIQKDETAARLLAYIKAAMVKGLVTTESERDFANDWREWRALPPPPGNRTARLFVRKTDDGDKVYKHVLYLNNIFAKCTSEFNDLVTKRALLIRKARAITENKEDPNVDDILYELIDMVNTGQKQNSEKFGMVAACIIDPAGHQVRALNYKIENDKHRVHAERAAIEKYMELYKEVPEGCIIISTLSPCSEHMHDRAGKSCTSLLNDYKIQKTYCGYIDPTQPEKNRKFKVFETNNSEIRKTCKAFADTFL